jgi:hypothetical protein
MKKEFLTGLTALLLAIGLIVAGCEDGSTDDSPPAPTAAEQATGLAGSLGDGAAVDPNDPTKVNVTGEVSVTGTVSVGAGVTLALSGDGAALTGDGKIVLAGDLVDERTGEDGYFGALADDTFTIEVRAGATLSTKDDSADRPLFGAPSDAVGADTPYFQLDGSDKVELVGDGSGAVTIKVTAGAVELNRTEEGKSWTVSEDLPFEIAPGATLVVKGGNLNVDDDALTVNGALEIKSGSHLARPAALFTNGSNTGKIKVYEGGSIIRLYGDGTVRASLVISPEWGIPAQRSGGGYDYWVANDQPKDKGASYFLWNDDAISGAEFITFDLGTKAITISDGGKIKLQTPKDAVTSTSNWLVPIKFKSSPAAPASGAWEFASLTVSNGTLEGNKPASGSDASYVIDTGGVVSGTGLGTSVATHTWSTNVWN